MKCRVQEKVMRLFPAELSYQLSRIQSIEGLDGVKLWNCPPSLPPIDIGVRTSASGGQNLISRWREYHAQAWGGWILQLLKWIKKKRPEKFGALIYTLSNSLVFVFVPEVILIGGIIRPYILYGLVLLLFLFFH